MTPLERPWWPLGADLSLLDDVRWASRIIVAYWFALAFSEKSHRAKANVLQGSASGPR